MRHLLVFVFVTMFSAFGFAQSQQALGRECIYNLYQKKDYNKVTTYFSDNLKKDLTASKLSQTDLLLQKLGDYKGIIEINKDEKGIYYYYVRFENQPMDVIMKFDDKNKITGLTMSSVHKEFKSAKK
ncbi:Protein of unknown function [Cruoricaptor ignavus]|uniref:DUF3887 domain-containing protein n=1 Tax=Cruoricaptor ignavus TaxID=1118202 RepID=A0A1M6EVG3_9FLAO|nr:DUF3887 domain-containing protein [Cruoricaptor ignavus]SHI89457.1 Protein of unknown function [Cruoricaptor ignavus]